VVALDAAVGDVLTQRSAHEPDDGPESAPAGNTVPDRVLTVSQRLVRSVDVALYVKSLHDDTCQACGTRLALDLNGRAYSEAAHVRALGRPHSGPDVPQNALCLCPNCHVLFDNGAMLIEPDMEVMLNGVHTCSLRTHPSHVIEPAHFAYHRSIHQ
jgi:predicted restriction endonuclease